MGVGPYHNCDEMGGVCCLMSKVSVIIPARNEQFLQKTIECVLKAAAEDVEVIAVCDGYWPDPPVQDDPRVTMLHFSKAKGQRAAINRGVAASTGEYIMKLDAHCTVSKGFDKVLKKDCKYEWTLVPRMYNLDVETWERKKHKRTDFMFITSMTHDKPFRATYYDNSDGFGFGEFKPSCDDTIVDTMCVMGPCFFMHKARFLELGGCDEKHGGWGQQGVEVSCKAWLSGGALKTHKGCWFAHWFRGGGVPPGFKSGAPWPQKQKRVNAARAYSQDLWLNNKWEGQKRDFQWMVDKFNPPTWDPTDLTIVYYTANRIPNDMAEKVRASIKQAAGSCPIISVSKKPIDFGKNRVVDLPYEPMSIYKQLYIGAQAADTKYVALVEDDCLYTPEHFAYRPPAGVFAYNYHRYNLLTGAVVAYASKFKPVLSQCICERSLLLAAMAERLKAKPKREHCGEFGLFEKAIGITEREILEFRTKKPNVVLCHGKNISGRKIVKGTIVDELDGWGKATDVAEEYVGGGAERVQLSVIIPSFKDPCLHKTIADILKNFTTNFEVIPVIDGYKLKEPIVEDPRVKPIYLEKNVGMREAINTGVAAARGECIMRFDEHCTMAKGFDRTLIKDLQDNQIMTARRYFLDPKKWEVMPNEPIDYERLIVLKPPQPRKFSSVKWKGRTKERANVMVDETMAMQGSMWVMRRSWWDKVIGKLQTEGYGPHYQDSTEMVFKTWKAGGKLMLNKNTWYAHKHRDFDRTHQYSTEKAIPEWEYALNEWYSYYTEVMAKKWKDAVHEHEPLITKRFRNSPFRVEGERHFSVDRLWTSRHVLVNLGTFWEAFDLFVDAILSGVAPNDLKDQRVQGYYNYLVPSLKQKHRKDGKVTGQGHKKLLRIMRDGKLLVDDIVSDGMKAPLTFYIRGKEDALHLTHGARRLVIAHKLGMENVTLRVFKTREDVRLHEHPDQWQIPKDPLPSIQEVAVQHMIKYGGVRTTDKYYAHGYTKLYDGLWPPAYRARKRKILEIGICRGYSLRLLHDIFPKSRIYGVDIRERYWDTELKRRSPSGSPFNKRVETMVGDSRDKEFMKTVVAKGPFDVIIDDGDHTPEAQMATYESLWPSVKNHGWYIIEDCSYSYRKNASSSVPEYFAKMVPDLYNRHNLLSLQFWYNLCAIQKGLANG